MDLLTDPCPDVRRTLQEYLYYQAEFKVWDLPDEIERRLQWYNNQFAINIEAIDYRRTRPFVSASALQAAVKELWDNFHIIWER